MFPSTREEYFYFEEEIATTFGEGQSVDTHFCQWLVSISLHSTVQVTFQPKNTCSVQMRALKEISSLYDSCRTSEQPHGFSKGVKVTLLVHEPYKTLNFITVIFMSLAFCTKITFLCHFVLYFSTCTLV